MLGSRDGRTISAGSLGAPMRSWNDETCIVNGPNFNDESCKGSDKEISSPAAQRDTLSASAEIYALIA
jgi:hypothetical protein